MSGPLQVDDKDKILVVRMGNRSGVEVKVHKNKKIKKPRGQGVGCVIQVHFTSFRTAENLGWRGRC